MAFSIPQFFRGKNLLIIGGTGFLAKALTEKILRDLPEIERLFLLIRPQVTTARPVSAEERLDVEVRGNSIFNRLRQELGAKFDVLWTQKVVCVPGDLSRPQFGLGDAEYAELQKKIDLVFNCAATVVFDERLDTALELNVLGPKRALEFAKVSSAGFIHISTAYVSGRREGRIPDELLSPAAAVRAQWPAAAAAPEVFSVEDEIERLQQCVSEIRRRFSAPDAASRLRFELVEAGMRRAQNLGWNDTYAFTKFLGEQCVRQYRGSVSALIVRPSIIESSLREPEPGWIDGLRMGDPLIIGLGKARISDFPVHREMVLDMIPVDLTVNAILAGATTLAEPSEDVRLLTIASGSVNPLNGRDLVRLCVDHFATRPMRNRKGRAIKPWQWSFPSQQESRRRIERRYLPVVRLACHLLNRLALLPGIPALRRRLQRLQLQLEQILYYVKIYGPYTNLRCRFDITRAMDLHARLSPEDRVRFSFDPAAIDWRHYICEIHIPGLKRHVLRLPAAVSAPSSSRRYSGSASMVNSAGSGSLVRRNLRWVAEKTIALLMSSYWQLECRGWNKLPANGPCIFVANHCSHLDWLAVGGALRKQVPDLCVMGAEDYFFDSSLKSWFFTACFNVLPFNRHERAFDSLERCRELLKSGRSVFLFPEGTRSVTGALQPFKAGIGVLAIKLDVPFVPMHVHGTFELMPKGRKVPRFGPIEVRIGTAVDFSELKSAGSSLPPKERCREAAMLLHDHVAALASCGQHHVVDAVAMTSGPGLST